MTAHALHHADEPEIRTPTYSGPCRRESTDGERATWAAAHPREIQEQEEAARAARRAKVRKSVATVGLPVTAIFGVLGWLGKSRADQALADIEALKASRLTHVEIIAGTVAKVDQHERSLERIERRVDRLDRKADRILELLEVGPARAPRRPRETDARKDEE